MTRAAVIGLLSCSAACGFHPAGEGDANPVDARVDATDAAAEPDGSEGVPDAPPSTLLCPPGYGPIGDSTTMYRIVETTATWTAAAVDCNDDDDLVSGIDGHTHLLVVGSDTEKLALTGQFSGNTWVGLTDEAVEGTFVWVTSEPTNGFPQVGQEPPWDAGDPDGGRGENCVRFKNSFDFEDKACDSANSYVCECDRLAPN